MQEEGFISGASNLLDHYDENELYPDIEEEFSYENFDKYILNAPQNFKEIMKIIRQGELNDLQIRFSVWRYLLGVLPVTEDLSQLRISLEKQREEYKNYFTQFKSSKQPSKAKEAPLKPKPSKVNPLAPPPKKKEAQAQQNNPWQGLFEDNFVKNEIRKDVERTYQDKEFFNSLKIKNILSNILFVWSKLNPEISYRQGMNELAASLIVIYFTEGLQIRKGQPENVSEQTYSIANYMINLQYAEADIYHVFDQLMKKGQQSMFVHKEDPKLKKQNTPILARLAKIQDYFLKKVDIELFRHMKLLEVQFSTFLLKWVKCIFTREYKMHITFTIWDNIFMDAYLFPNQKFENLTDLNRDNYEINNFFLIDCICLGMLVRIKETVMKIEDGNDVMKCYLEYPVVNDIRNIIDQGFDIKDQLLAYNTEKDQNLQQSKKFQVFNPKNPLRKDSYNQKKEENKQVQKKEQPTQKPQLFNPTYTQSALRENTQSSQDSPVKSSNNLNINKKQNSNPLQSTNVSSNYNETNNIQNNENQIQQQEQIYEQEHQQQPLIRQKESTSEFNKHSVAPKNLENQPLFIPNDDSLDQLEQQKVDFTILDCKKTQEAVQNAFKLIDEQEQNSNTLKVLEQLENINRLLNQKQGKPFQSILEAIENRNSMQLNDL